MLSWSSPSVCPLDDFDCDRADMRRRKLSKDHDGGSYPEGTLLHSHNHAREWESENGKSETKDGNLEIMLEALTLRGL